MTDLRALAGHDEREIRALALRYLGVRLHDGGPSCDTFLAFTTLDGTPVLPCGYHDHLRALRRISGAAEANAEMCRIYLNARVSRPAPGFGVEDREAEDFA